jgi:hypothetical protein
LRHGTLTEPGSFGSVTWSDQGFHAVPKAFSRLMRTPSQAENASSILVARSTHDVSRGKPGRGPARKEVGGRAPAAKKAAQRSSSATPRPKKPAPGRAPDA